jgi:hypothetical protein
LRRFFMCYQKVNACPVVIAVLRARDTNTRRPPLVFQLITDS